ncbi:MAG: hypothetical protein RSF37_12160 [Clostridium sp.]|uniref:hypothetical protein n=1 Tax=Clostridium sp. TaxID=1506 RepID=UPI002FC807DE
MNIVTFIFISVAISVNSNNKNTSFFINSIMVIGIIILSIAAILSLKNIKKQYINSNKLIILGINFICVVSVIPAFLISIIMPLVDIGILIRHIESLGIYHRT